MIVNIVNKSRQVYLIATGRLSGYLDAFYLVFRLSLGEQTFYKFRIVSIKITLSQTSIVHGQMQNISSLARFGLLAHIYYSEVSEVTHIVFGRTL